MIVIDVAETGTTGLSFWIPKKPLATAYARPVGTSGKKFIYEFGATNQTPRGKELEAHALDSMPRAVVRAVEYFIGVSWPEHEEGWSHDMLDAFLIEDGYVGRNKRTSLQIADMRGRIAQAMLQRFNDELGYDIVELPRPQPDEWRESVRKVLAPDMNWMKKSAEKKQQMLELAKREWPDLPRIEVLTTDEADSLGMGKHWYSSGGYFEK